jgi:hypothetical protein
VGPAVGGLSHCTIGSAVLSLASSFLGGVDFSQYTVRLSNKDHIVSVGELPCSYDVMEEMTNGWSRLWMVASPA